MVKHILDLPAKIQFLIYGYVFEGVWLRPRLRQRIRRGCNSIRPLPLGLSLLYVTRRFCRDRHGEAPYNPLVEMALFENAVFHVASPFGLESLQKVVKQIDLQRIRCIALGEPKDILAQTVWHLAARVIPNLSLVFVKLDDWTIGPDMDLESWMDSAPSAVMSCFKVDKQVVLSILWVCRSICINQTRVMLHFRIHLQDHSLWVMADPTPPGITYLSCGYRVHTRQKDIFNMLIESRTLEILTASLAAD